MENADEARTWQGIVRYYPEWAQNYNVSASECFDAAVEQYRQKVKGRTRLSERDSTDILLSLAQLHAVTEHLQSDETLLVQGRGMYYAEDSQTFDFIDGSPGISGYFTGMRIDRLPLYHDMVYRSRLLYRPLLCIALEGYSLHNKDHTPGIFVDDTAIIPIIGQDLCITHYDSSTVGKGYQ
jgi:hypothetical protein